MDKRNIFIIGGGAMGCLFGAFLSSNNQVTIFDTNEQVVSSIQRAGITLTAMNGSVKSYPVQIVPYVTDYESKADLVIIFTKAKATREAAEAAQEVLSPDGLVLTLQNGIGHLEIINSILGSDKTIAGVTAQAANTIAPGQANHAGAGVTTLGSTPALNKKVSTLCQIFNEADISTVIGKDTDSLIWGKLIVNVGINALTAILRVPNGALAESKETIDLMEQLVDEAVLIARELGINLPYAKPMEEVLKVARITANNRASMLQDVLNTTPTEIEVINGAIAKKGRELGIATPANDLITGIIKAIEVTGDKRIRE